MAASPAAQAQAAFNSRWGQIPASQAKIQRDAGQGGVTNTAGAPAPAPAPTASPEQAGAINSAQPGFFNGNAENGIPKAEGGFAPPPPAAPPVPPGQRQAMPGTQTGQVQSQSLAAALEMPGQAQEAAEPGAPTARSMTNGYTEEDLWEGQDPNNNGPQPVEPLNPTPTVPPTNGQTGINDPNAPIISDDPIAGTMSGFDWNSDISEWTNEKIDLAMETSAFWKACSSFASSSSPASVTASEGSLRAESSAMASKISW
jgi:hypothetical protein